MRSFLPSFTFEIQYSFALFNESVMTSPTAQGLKKSIVKLKRVYGHWRDMQKVPSRRQADHATFNGAAWIGKAF